MLLRELSRGVAPPKGVMSRFMTTVSRPKKNEMAVLSPSVLNISWLSSSSMLLPPLSTIPAVAMSLGGTSFASYYSTSSSSNVTRTLVASSLENDDDSDHLHYLQPPKKGTGFDNFTPRHSNKNNDHPKPSTPTDSGDQEEDEKNDKTATTPDKGTTADQEKKDQGEQSFASSSSSSGRDGGGGGKNNNNNNTDPNRLENWIPALVMLLVTYYLSRRPGADDPPEGKTMDREISWHDFLRLLQQQDIVKVVVSDDRQSARVYLKPNARGLSSRISSTTAAAAGVSNSSRYFGTQRTASYEEQRRQRAAAMAGHHENQQNALSETEHDAFHDQEQEQIELSGSSSAGATATDTGMTSTLGRQAHAPFFYRMHIGSVESFERKLDEAQRALKRDPGNDVPVQYLPESVCTPTNLICHCEHFLSLCLQQVVFIKKKLTYHRCHSFILIFFSQLQSVGRELLGTVPGLLLALVMFGVMRFASGSVGVGGVSILVLTFFVCLSAILETWQYC
jgi:hypothetical protein